MINHNNLARRRGSQVTGCDAREDENSCQLCQPHEG